MTLEGMAYVEARRLAVCEVKALLRRRGIKASLMSRKEILIRADAYLAANRAVLLAEARERVSRWSLPR
jgi:hypothetical protein